MTTLTFDTHAFVKKLKDVGFSEEQAETITELQKTTVANTLEQARHDYELDNLATKRDLKEMETTLKKDIELLRADSRRDIAESKAELIRWVMGVGLLQTTILAGLMFRLADKI
jgi:DNA gyrase/topoisomerase IV subunit A